MTTITFTVAAPSGAPVATIDGDGSYVSTYLALNPSTPLVNNVVFCIAPDLIASHGLATYTVLPGISDGFSATQVNALQGLFSHYITGGDTSFATQEAVMIADWTIVNPHLSVTGAPSSVMTNANALVTEALAGDFTVASNLEFQTFLSQDGAQSFVNVFDPVVPIPPSLGLFMSALVLLVALGIKKKISLRQLGA